MSTPSRDDPADDGLIDRWLERHETSPDPEQPGEDVQPDDSAPATEAIEPAPRPQPADPLTAPLSELFADPFSGPLLHPLLNIDQGLPLPAEPLPAEPDPVEPTDPPTPPRDEAAPVTATTDEQPAEPEPPVPQPADDEIANSDSTHRPGHGPATAGVDTTGFTPSAPLDVFAALRGTSPAQPNPEERRNRLSGMLQRRQPQPSTKAEKPEAARTEAAGTEAAEPRTTNTQITDAAIAGPALAAILKAEESSSQHEQPATSGKVKAKGPINPLETLLTEEPSSKAPTAPADATAYDEQATPAPDQRPEPESVSEPEAHPNAAEPQPEGGPTFETLEELLNAVTARTHPPAPLNPVEDAPAVESSPAQPRAEPLTKAQVGANHAPPALDDPRRSTAADVARQLAATVPTGTASAGLVGIGIGIGIGSSQPAPPQPTGTAARNAPTPKSPVPPKPQKPTEQANPVIPHDTIDLTARSSTQHILLVLLLIGVVTTAVLAWLAWQEKSVTSIAFAVTAAVVTFVIWSAHSTAAPPTVVVERGQLDIRTHDSHHRFDLASHSTNFEVEGSPGRRGWKVLIHRTGMPPYKLDATMVDPQEFTAVLDRYRGQA